MRCDFQTWAPITACEAQGSPDQDTASSGTPDEFPDSQCRHAARGVTRHQRPAAERRLAGRRERLIAGPDGRSPHPGQPSCAGAVLPARDGQPHQVEYSATTTIPAAITTVVSRGQLGCPARPTPADGVAWRWARRPGWSGRTGWTGQRRRSGYRQRSRLPRTRRAVEEVVEVQLDRAGLGAVADYTHVVNTE